MNAFLNKINLENIKYVGFDMDGTLYDEFDFIVQVYKEISDLFVLHNNVFEHMSLVWLEKGSSYNKIFDETYDLFKLKNMLDKQKFIKEALYIFRNYKPKLTLTPRVTEILKYFYNSYRIFLVTDGNYKLQEAKFKALGLEKYFEIDNVVFTGKYSDEYYKPNTKSIELLNINPKEAIYFGDRIQDELFAKSSRMEFKKVYNMIEVI